MQWFKKFTCTHAGDNYEFECTPCLAGDDAVLHREMRILPPQKIILGMENKMHKRSNHERIWEKNKS